MFKSKSVDSVFDEEINWFNDYFNNCYYVKHEDYPESIFMFYDINYVRQLKLAKLEGKNYVEKTDITGVCLFEQDWKNNHFNVNHDIIWLYFRDKYLLVSYKYYDFFLLFLKNRLNEHTISKYLITLNNIFNEKLNNIFNEKLNDDIPLNILNPFGAYCYNKFASKSTIDTLMIRERYKVVAIPKIQ